MTIGAISGLNVVGIVFIVLGCVTIAIRDKLPAEGARGGREPSRWRASVRMWVAALQIVVAILFLVSGH